MPSPAAQTASTPGTAPWASVARKPCPSCGSPPIHGPHSRGQRDDRSAWTGAPCATTRPPGPARSGRCRCARRCHARTAGPRCATRCGRRRRRAEPRSGVTTVSSTSSRPRVAHVLGGQQRELVERQRPGRRGRAGRRPRADAPGVELGEQPGEGADVARAGEGQRARDGDVGRGADGDEQRVVVERVAAHVRTRRLRRGRPPRAGRAAGGARGRRRCGRGRSAARPAAERLGDRALALDEVGVGLEQLDLGAGPRWSRRAISASRPAIPPPAMTILGMSLRLGPGGGGAASVASRTAIAADELNRAAARSDRARWRSARTRAARRADRMASAATRLARARRLRRGRAGGRQRRPAILLGGHHIEYARGSEPSAVLRRAAGRTGSRSV